MQDQIKDIDRLLDIQEFSTFILDNKPTEEQFHQDKLIQYALLKVLENIGEAARQISKNTKVEFDGLEWDKMIAARNVYTHEYLKLIGSKFGEV